VGDTELEQSYGRTGYYRCAGQFRKECEAMQGNLAETIEPGLLSVAGVCKYLGFSPTTIYKMVNTGELRSFVYKRRRCIPKTECDRWQAAMLAAQNDDDA
jgi:excisionase family DNA binding protein